MPKHLCAQACVCVCVHTGVHALVGLGNRTEIKTGHPESHDQEATETMLPFANHSHPLKELEP